MEASKQAGRSFAERNGYQDFTGIGRQEDTPEQIARSNAARDAAFARYRKRNRSFWTEEDWERDREERKAGVGV